ncbi:MAG: hypothetical protein EBX50_10480 [Chitinophagia bacterium]|nr:hypothetical protein [Chitinophagia bacterium]
MNNKFIFEVGFSKGKAIYKKMIQPNKSSSSGNIKSNGCVSFYLNTFWSDGSVTREYLFTTCSSDPSPCEQTRFLDLVSDQNIITRINCGGHGGSGSANVDIQGDLIVNTKIKCAFNLVKNLVDKTGGMGDVLGFVNSFSTVIVSDDYKGRYPAITEKLIPGSGTSTQPIKIRVNCDLLKNAPQELTVAILLHEFLHAYLQKAEPEGVSDHYTILNNYSLLVAEQLKTMFPDISPEDTWGLILSGLAEDIDLWKDPEYKAAFDDIASKHGISREKAKEIFNKFLANGAGTPCK